MEGFLREYQNYYFLFNGVFQLETAVLPTLELKKSCTGARKHEIGKKYIWVFYICPLLLCLREHSNHTIKNSLLQKDKTFTFENGSKLF